MRFSAKKWHKFAKKHFFQKPLHSAVDVAHTIISLGEMDDSNYNKQKNTLQLFFVRFRSCLQDQAVLLQEGQDNETNMKNDDKRALAFG